jgi:hypothetical protein
MFCETLVNSHQTARRHIPDCGRAYSVLNSSTRLPEEGRFVTKQPVCQLIGCGRFWRCSAHVPLLPKFAARRKWRRGPSD